MESDTPSEAVPAAFPLLSNLIKVRPLPVPWFEGSRDGKVAFETGMIRTLRSPLALALQMPVDLKPAQTINQLPIWS